jgi:hypothetical protein
MTKRDAAGRLGVGAVVTALILLFAGVRLVGDGRAALTASDAAFARGDVALAVVHARAAARAYVPFAVHMEQGLFKLREIAKKSERAGDTEAALFAWRAVLSVAASTRPFGAVTEKERAEAEAAVARLSAEMRSSARAGPRARPEGDAETALTGGDSVPRLGWAALLLTGAALWLAAGRRLTSRGWGTDGRLAAREVGAAGAMALAGLVAWLTGLWLV